MDIVNMIKRVVGIYKLMKIKDNIEISKDSFYGSGFRIELRSPIKNKIYFKCGKNCVLDGSYIFETETGIVSVGNRVHIGASTFISREAIIIGDDVTIAWGCLIYDHNSHSVDWKERKNDTIQEYCDLKNRESPIKNKDWSVVKSSSITIGPKAWIGANVIILKGVTIGEGAVVAAGSVVVKDVEPWTVVGGNPAKKVRSIMGDNGE